MDYVLRFFVGGAVISVFAVLGDVLRPKSVAGLFGAAPSVALATLAFAYSKYGADYTAIEGRSMVLGAVAFMVYGILVCQLLMRTRWSAFAATLVAFGVWIIAAAALEQLALG